MEKLQKLLMIWALVVPALTLANSKEVPFTLDDRDRIIRTEQKLDMLNKSIDDRFETMFSFLYAIVGIFTTLTVSIFGFAFWDRKISISPVRREQRKILGALAEYAKKEPLLMESMKRAGLW